jgi:hypothetical protein
MIGPDDEAMIMDFGIARSTGSPTSSAVPGPDTIARGLRNAIGTGVRIGTGTNLDSTTYGAVVGTVEYMAPEQAKGQPVDQRADVYAFGLILYDLLTGERRGYGENPITELQARMKQAPPAIKTLVPEVPDHVDAIVSRCLEPEADKRFATSQEVADALALLDDEGIPIPIPPRFSTKLIAAVATLVLSLVTATWYFTRTPPPPKQHDPVSVLIADFDNKTNDPSLAHTLEPALKFALEGAGFITAYDRTGVATLGGGRAPEIFDEPAALQLAVKQAVGIVVSGALERQGSGYSISVKATHPVTGNSIASSTIKAGSRDDLLSGATKLAAVVRTALGDETEQATIFAKDTLSAASVDVVRQYASGMELLTRARFDEALQSFSKSVEMDPKFGMGYEGMAFASRNLDRQEDAEKYAKEALRHIDSMTERERFRTRAFYYRVTGDYQACVKEYGDLTAQFAADVTAHNQVALCSTFLRDMPKAVDEMRQIVKIMPNSTIFRNNLALYLSYSGDFAAGEEEAKAIQNPGVNSLIALAFGQLGRNAPAEALDAYKKLAAIDAQGASRAVSGAGDVAIYEGRFADAARILGEGAAGDVAAKEPNRAAAKFAALAFAQLSRKQNAAAIAAASNALKNSQTVKIRFLAGRVFAEAGESRKALDVATSLAADVHAEPQAYAKIIRALTALKAGDRAEAIKTLTEANTQLDTWIGHLDLARANLEAGQFIEADSELDRCIKRRGEALALFLDEEPTYGYLPQVYYYQGRARQGLNSAGFAESYREYLKIRGSSPDDPLLPDVRKQAGN